MTNQKKSQNSPRVRDAVKAAADELMAMSSEEFKALLDKTSKKMKEARKNGEFSWGNTIWYGMDPDGYTEQLKEEGLIKNGTSESS